MSDAARLAAAWADDLASWAIPPAIVDAAPESPYGFPVELFVRRAAASHDREELTTTSRALEGLGDGGSVLDVGAGGGATSLPLASRCTELVAVDAQIDMLEALASTASAQGLAVTTVLGRWPDVAPRTPIVDVVVSGHVAYNAPDLAAFLTALTMHARRRVVVELTDRHPLTFMNDLWLHFHGVVRPEHPSAHDAEALCRALGLDVRREDRTDTDDVARGGFERRADVVGLIRRRLCLPPERDDEIARALGDRLRERAGSWTAGPPEQQVVTLWWDAPD